MWTMVNVTAWAMQEKIGMTWSKHCIEMSKGGRESLSYCSCGPKKIRSVELFKKPLGTVYNGATFEQSQTLTIRSPMFKALQDKRLKRKLVDWMWSCSFKKNLQVPLQEASNKSFTFFQPCQKGVWMQVLLPFPFFVSFFFLNFMLSSASGSLKLPWQPPRLGKRLNDKRTSPLACTSSLLFKNCI